MLKAALFLSLISFSFLAQASYFQAELRSSNVDPSMGTHLIIAGFGGPAGESVGDQWLSIGHTQALIFNDKQKHGAIKLISYINSPKTIDSKLKRWNYENVKVMNQTMTGSRIVSLIGQNQKIASIDFIGHNGAFMGFALEDYSNRFYLNNVKELAAFKSQFSADSYIRIMGCNTGWYLAPVMAEKLGVPTSGTFTYADIQDLYDTKTFYYSDVGRVPKEARLMTENKVSFSAPTSCPDQGGCKRLKPVSISYNGMRGKYIGVLPFMKYFCGSMNISECAKRAALSVTTNISSNYVADKPTVNQYADAVSDLMCSAWKDLSRRADCIKAINEHVIGIKTLSPNFTTIDTKTTADKTLVCNFKSCEAKVIQDDKGQNILTGVFNKPSTAFTDEVNFYKLGFSLLK